MKSCENDAVEGSHSGEKQGGCQASVSQPCYFSRKHASCYKDVITIAREVSISRRRSEAQ